MVEDNGGQEGLWFHLRTLSSFARTCSTEAIKQLAGMLELLHQKSFWQRAGLSHPALSCTQLSRITSYNGSLDRTDNEYEHNAFGSRGRDRVI